MVKEPRFEIRTGKFGQYFYDNDEEKDLALADILYLLNEANARTETSTSPVVSWLHQIKEQYHKNQYLNALAILYSVQGHILSQLSNVLKERANG